jgi:hypothetical protein
MNILILSRHDPGNINQWSAIIEGTLRYRDCEPELERYKKNDIETIRCQNLNN